MNAINVLIVIAVLLWTNSLAADFERRDITFKSEGLRCSGWYYVTKNLKQGEKHPAIVMAHGFSAVKEMNLDGFARRFAEAGFIVLVFDYRFIGSSEGEPRGQISYFDQISDYRNAITWVSLQNDVDPERIGIWGTSFSGGHVLCIAAIDKRVKAVVAQVPFTGTNVENMIGDIAKDSKWLIQNRNDEYLKNKVNYIPVVDSAGKFAVLPQREAYDWFTKLAKEKAPTWENRVTIKTLDQAYNPNFYVPLISQTPLLMIIASNDIPAPTEEAKKTFELAKTIKKLVIVEGGHFDSYQGPAFDKYCQPAVDWFKQYLKP